jgi:hypothetical protein
LLTVADVLAAVLVPCCYNHMSRPPGLMDG